MTRYVRGVLLGAVAGSLLACPALAGIINGSFETGDFTGWLKQEVDGFAEVVPGGTDGQWMAQLTCEGGYSVNDPDLFVPALVAVWQSLEVQPGDNWLLFDAWVEGNVTLRGIIPWQGILEVVVTSQMPHTYAMPVADMQGHLVTLAFEARDYALGTNVAHVDNVRLVEVAEPASLVLAAVGLLAAYVVPSRPGQC